MADMVYEDFRLEVVRHILTHLQLPEESGRVTFYGDGYIAGLS